MRRDETNIRVLAHDYGKCYDFYTEVIGLIPLIGGRVEPYTSFALSEGDKPCFAMFSYELMSMLDGYKEIFAAITADSVAAVIPSLDFDKDVKRLEGAGVKFENIRKTNEDFVRRAFFRDPEGNLFELSGESQ